MVGEAGFESLSTEVERLHRPKEFEQDLSKQYGNVSRSHRQLGFVWHERILIICPTCFSSPISAACRCHRPKFSVSRAGLSQ